MTGVHFRVIWHPRLSVSIFVMSEKCREIIYLVFNLLNCLKAM
jgi:hypothetical protein